MVSKPAKKDMHENFGVPLKKLSVIYNFSDTGKIKRLIKEDLPADFIELKKAHKKLIVSTGRMERVKRQERLIKLLGRIRNEKGLEDTGLVILGDGPERERIVSEAKKLSLLSHVYAPGNVSNPFKYMALCDLFVLCSDYEGLPMVLTEAAACRLPSVSADMPSGAREILAPDTDPEYKTDGVEYARFGVLTRPFEYAGGENFLEIKEDKAEEYLFSGVLRLLTDSELYESYRSKAPALAARFSEERMLGIWLGLIRRR
jgi:glycosyltransferase involved in cell wall biosynthesis